MIKYEWRNQFDAHEIAELADLLDRASKYDAEAEYNTIDIADVERTLKQSDPRVKHLVIWMLPYSATLGGADQPEQIAGLMRIVVADDGTARGAIVIDPRLRSIGITTLFLERVGLDTSGAQGWLGTGAHTVTAWAQGNHPAAPRLSNRFLIPSTRRVWKLIRSAVSAEDATAAPVLEQLAASILDEGLSWVHTTGVGQLLGLREAGKLIGVVELDIDQANSEEFGRCATITTLDAAPTAAISGRRRLLEGAAAVTHETGLGGLIVHVDSDDTQWVNACRLAGFQHDRTDVRFQFGAKQ